ncbi:MAG: DUF4418 family protein [Chloroflexi bacterium]|nr:DUF4418 family protein [Chloroflexota bacterium]
MKIIGTLVIVLALLIGIVPQFTDCQSQGRELTLADGRKIPMKCHWTARAELGLAIPLLMTGVVMTASKRKELLRGLSVVSSTLGLVAVLLPTALIGVCGNPDMVCNSTMRPFLTLAGAVVLVLGIVGVVRSMTQKDEDAMA